MNSKRHHSNESQQHRQHGGTQSRSGFPFEIERIALAEDELMSDMFSSVAEDAAKHVAEWDEQSKEAGKQASKSTQLRKFYDEICMWHSKVQDDSACLQKNLPLILMLKAKVAYSEGRKHVNKAYVNVLNRCLDQLQARAEPRTLQNLKLFMEAFTGFYKVYGPK